MNNSNTIQKLLDFSSQAENLAQLQPTVLQLKLLDYSYFLQSNSAALLTELKQYFGHLITECSSDTLPKLLQDHQSLKMVFWQIPIMSELIEQTEWTDCYREPGKKGRKEAVFDDPQLAQRAVFKVKTGMIFLQPALPALDHHNDVPNAFGPCEDHPNQIINFILTQFLNRHQLQGWTLGHASALQLQHTGLAIAGLSGGGKSTLMLKLMNEGANFVSNDRILFRRLIADNQNSSELILRGIPKQPRINPGTIVHNEQIQSLFSPEKRQSYLDMPTEALRGLEEKYDLMIADFYGAERQQLEIKLQHIIVLNWGQDTETSLTQSTFQESPLLLPALMKSPGPFYSDHGGKFINTYDELEAKPYQKVLQTLPVWELNGKIDFEAAVALIKKALF